MAGTGSLEPTSLGLKTDTEGPHDCRLTMDPPAPPVTVVAPKKNVQLTSEEIIDYSRGKIAEYQIPKQLSSPMFYRAMPPGRSRRGYCGKNLIEPEAVQFESTSPGYEV